MLHAITYDGELYDHVVVERERVTLVQRQGWAPGVYVSPGRKYLGIRRARCVPAISRRHAAVSLMAALLVRSIRAEVRVRIIVDDDVDARRVSTESAEIMRVGQAHAWLTSAQVDIGLEDVVRHILRPSIQAEPKAGDYELVGILEHSG